MNSSHRKIFGILVICFIAIIFRIYHLNFGLPHTFYADEPEFTEPAIKYTYQIKNIIKNNDYYELIPISYVYGTVPTYFLTTALMIFSKSLNVLNIPFDKYTIFVFFRVLIVFISLGVVWAGYVLAKKTTHFAAATNEKLSYLPYALAFLALNYKFIVHAHYVNADIVLTLLLLCSFLLFYNYLQKPDDKNLFWAGVFFGLAVGTKITALISLPIFLALILKKKDLYGLPGFFLSAALAFIATNPFSLAFFGDFSFRIYSMLTKEAGMVFDSVDYSPFKYLSALVNMATLPVLVFFVYEIFVRIRNKKLSEFDWFLVINLVVYLLFFSIQSRRVDRWMLPMLPLILIYSGHGLNTVIELIPNKKARCLFVILIFSFYFIQPIQLLAQFQRWTPKAQAYIWADKNLPETATKLAYTEEGLDPLNKLGFAKVIQFNAYVSEGAQLSYPENPELYDYVIVSSRPMENFKKPEVIKAYPSYSQAWQNFENTLMDSTKFELVNSFVLPKPNLIPLSNVYIYKKL